jgi:hypothetical protein
MYCGYWDAFTFQLICREFERRGGSYRQRYKDSGVTKRRKEHGEILLENYRIIESTSGNDKFECHSRLAARNLFKCGMRCEDL